MRALIDNTSMFVKLSWRGISRGQGLKYWLSKVTCSEKDREWRGKSKYSDNTIQYQINERLLTNIR